MNPGFADDDALVTLEALASEWGVEVEAIRRRIATSSFADPVASDETPLRFRRRDVAPYRTGLQPASGGDHLHDPPDVPVGWSTAPPDFVGVGAPRSATTWWFNLVCAHPRLMGSPVRHKELHFFRDRQAGAVAAGRHPGAPGLAELYARYFPRPAGWRAGEWTPLYLYQAAARAGLAEAAPEARLIVLLRDPMTRLRSAVNRYGQRRGREPDDDAFALEVGRSAYAEPLAALIAAAGRERVLVLQHEACVADPAGELARTLTFIGVSPEPPAADRVRATPNRRNRTFVIGSRREDEARATLVADARRLRDMIGDDVDLSLWDDLLSGRRAS
jgi:hypothetical protein